MLHITRPAKMRECLGLSEPTFYRQLNDGLLPPLVPISTRGKGCVTSEYDEVIRARVAGETDDEIRELVQEIVGRRIKASRQGREVV